LRSHAACVPDAAVDAVVIGGDVAPTIAGADTMWHVRHAELDDYAPEAWGDALHQLAAAVRPAAIVATGTERGNEVLAHVAASPTSRSRPRRYRDPPARPADPARPLGGSLLEDATLTAGLPILSCALHVYPERPVRRAHNVDVRVAEFVPVLQPDAGRTESSIGCSRRGHHPHDGARRREWRRGVGSEEGFDAIEALAELLGGARRLLEGRPPIKAGGPTPTRSDRRGQWRLTSTIACGIRAPYNTGWHASAKQVLAINTTVTTLVTKATTR